MRAITRFVSGVLIAVGAGILSLCASANAQDTNAPPPAPATNDYVDIACSTHCGFGKTGLACYSKSGSSCKKNKNTCKKSGTTYSCS